MTEEWRPVVGYEGLYEVSDQGRVRSLDRTYVRPHPTSPTGFQTVRQRGRMRKIALAKAGGYPMVTLRRDESKHVHRLVIEAFVGPCPRGMEVRHLDGNPENCRVDNLAYGSSAENKQDMLTHGTHAAANRTHCPQGHPYDDENTYSPPSRPGARYCRACHRLRGRKSYGPAKRLVYEEYAAFNCV